MAPGMDDHRETIWGIDPKDRQWFQLLTLIGGAAGSVTLAYLELAYGSTSAAPNEVARNILLGIGRKFRCIRFHCLGTVANQGVNYGNR